MRTEQREWTARGGWRSPAGKGVGAGADLVLVFGGRAALCDPHLLTDVRDRCPDAIIAGCSTAGEILDTRVSDGSVVATEVAFDTTRVRAADMTLCRDTDSREAGRKLASQLAADDLVHVLVFSDGLEVNGSELSRGMTDRLPVGVLVTGGLAGDGTDFNETLVVSGTEAGPRRLVAIGLYGQRLKIGCGSVGGWDPFGPERLITKSHGNVLFELDGRSALELYKTYLGDYAANLPASALLFPLSLRSGVHGPPVVRTVLSIDENEGSMTFAGDLPVGQYARLMRANFERLIDGASNAARDSHDTIGRRSPELAVLISCVGRRMVLQQRIEEEIESVREILGPASTLAGFYSYGEIAPFSPSEPCELHNQTMTITTLTEV
jgi:hypothetical protein